MENQSSRAATSFAASSSSSAADPNNSSSNNVVYDVFINHRGEVKKTFASHLYRSLLSRGLRPFLDQQELKEGLNFPSQLKAVIGSALVHVAIFSKKYAESQWCLDELVLMRQSGAPIIPVFYNVKPADIRWTDQNKGVYAEDLDRLQMKTNQGKPRYDSNTIENWKNAISAVANISGFDLDGPYNSDEGQMLDKLVQRVEEIRAKSTRLYVARYPTGLDLKVKEFETTVSKQQHSGKVQVAGIVGLGGAGKTTLALELFNRNKSKYDKSYFLSDVRENAKKRSLPSLQRELLKGLTQSDCSINNIYEGIGKLETYLRSSHVLFVLDDIDHENQLEAFLPTKDVLSSGSLILITSRDINVLLRSGVEQLSLYKLTGLTPEHSLELFCSYAFHQAYPLQGFEDLVNKFLKVCEGLPLSLKVLGAHLFGNNAKSDWEGVLQRVKVLPDIQDRLRISYDALSEEEKHIFLDIACFFIGEDKNSAIAVWNGSCWLGSLGFKSLEGKCLVEMRSINVIPMHDHLQDMGLGRESKTVIHMHDHVRDMGREIAENELPRRLWHPTQNIYDLVHQHYSFLSSHPFLGNNQVTARGIRMLPERHTTSQMLSTYQTSRERLANVVMKDTRYHFYGTVLLDSREHHLGRILWRLHSPHLMWLSWHACPFSCLPPWIPMENLRVLKVYGSLLKTLWQYKSQAPLQLRRLEIFDGINLRNIPESLGNLTYLQYMHLSDCLQLERLPDSFGNLVNLQYLTLIGCYNLERLPDSFGNLVNLQYLNLLGFYSLERLPDSFGNLVNLQHMCLGCCTKLARLPDSFDNLVNLQHLELYDFRKLARLPDSFGKLVNLQHLKLSYCYILERLPYSFVNLVNLQHMNLSRCSELERLPDSFGNLVNLQHMKLSYCKKLERLPDSFGNLVNLQHMNLSYCEKLERLPDSFGNLTNLQYIDLTRCSILERLPSSFGSLSSLKSFEASNCSNLSISSDTFGNIRTLEHIDLSNCGEIERWPSQLAHQRFLNTLKLRGTKFKELPSAIGDLSDLEVLWIGSRFLGTLPPSLGNLGNLKELMVQGCAELKRLPSSVGLLTQLTSLEVVGCPAMELPFKMVKGQRKTVGTLKSESSIHQYMSSLQRLTLQDDTEISEVSFDEDVCSNLQRFTLDMCRNVEKVVTLPSTLIHVELINCDNLRNIEGLRGLQKLRTLKIEECEELQELPSIETLVSLEELRVLGCVKLKTIRNLAQLTKLKLVSVFGCTELEELERVEYCMSLHNIYARDCPKLQWGEGVVERLRKKNVDISK